MIDAGHAAADVAVPGAAADAVAGRSKVVGMVDELDVRSQDLADEREEAWMVQEVEEDPVVLQDALDLLEVRIAAAGEIRVRRQRSAASSAARR